MPTRASRTSFSHATDTAAIDAYVIAQMRSMRIPGLALGIVKDNQVIYLRGYGVADPTGRPVTPQTPFIVGSITKSFTALALMQLVEQGKVELDTPVQRYIPWFRLADPDSSARLSLRHLLYHTGGISRYIGRELLVGQGDASLEQKVRELSRVQLLYPVGEVFQYSNANYLVLGLVVQIVSGQPYGEYVREHILQPLQMHHSFVSEADAQQDGMATGYRWWFGLPCPADVPYLSVVLPAGFLLASAEDMAHYLIAHLNGGQYGETSILSPAGTAELHRPGAAIGSTDACYGMGWVTESINGLVMLTHPGDTANFHADMIMLPESQWGIIVLTNVNNALVGQVEAVGKLGTWRVAAGIAGLLKGHQPPASKLNAKTFYVTLNMVMVLLSALQVWSLTRLLRYRRQPFPRQRLKQIQRVAPLIYELLVPLKVLVGLPKWTDASWNVLRLYAPDLAYWSLITLPLSLVTGMLRAMLIFFRRRHPAVNGQNRGQHRVE
jgi:CubicO group peptidase (beta-lactamase class C family)